ncbi:MAG TPA: zinc-dependent metalloprotease [Solirubrobacteraceae bacterium]|nr:zinc-dependent metalloprotease [Solirubrobacteraceae bacterium]
MDAIDWSTAQRVGDLIAGSPPAGAMRSERVQPLAMQFARRVSDYSGLELPAELPPLEAVDRSHWIAANLQTMRPILESLAADELGPGGSARRMRLRRKRPGQDLRPLYDALGAAGGLLLGAQVGAMAGVLSQRVLGQYDLALLDPSVTPRLLLVAPNLDQAARNMGVDGEQLLAWVTIHEITHAVQFSGAPWLREHLAGILRELIDGMQVTVSLGALMRLPGAGDARAFAERLRRGELVRLTLGEQRWRLVERLQSTMSLVEGHAEHVMDAVGAEVLPSLPTLRAAMTRRREHRGLPWRVLERLLGLELKMRQYEEGRRFCDAVVLAGGEEGPRLLARAWRSPEDLPTADELQAPELWLARMA